MKFPGQPPRDAPGSGGQRRRDHKLGSPDFCVFRPFRPTHTSFPPFLDPLNSFTWSFFADSSPLERYEKNKVGQLLDRVFRPPQQPLDQGEGTDVFMIS